MCSLFLSEITPKVEKESTKTKTDDPSVKFTKEVVTGVMPKKGGKGVKRKHKGIVEGISYSDVSFGLCDPF